MSTEFLQPRSHVKALFVAFLGLLPAFAHALPSAIAAFSFDETSGDVVVDDSGNGNGGFLDGGIDWNPAGRFNGGVEFFGFLPNRISLGGLDIPGNALTITGWFRADDFGTRDARILAKATGTSDADQYIMLSTFLQAGQIRLRFRLKTDIGDTTTLIANSGNLSPNTFYHVAAVYDGTEMRLYLDGALVGSTPKTGDIAQNPNANMWIGNNEMGRRPFDGVLDNLRIYDQALTPSELADDATTPVNSQTPPPTAPATPTGATANATSSSAIDVTWVDQSNNETGFDVERAMGSSGPFVLISTTPADATTFTDQGLAPATQYCYRIRAINNTESSNYTSQVCATTQSVTGSPSAIAAFSFDETSGDVVVDDSGNGNGGFLDGGIDWNPAGRFNGGVEFFGFLPNRISLGGLDIPGNALTITGWFRADDFGTRDARILAKATGTSDADQYIMLSTFLQAGQIRLRFRLKTDIGDTTTLIANSGNLSPNTFYHVAAVYDGTEMRLYLDGALVGSTPKTGDIAQNPNANMWIGNNEMGRRPFDGVLDNLRIYDQALTPSELADDATTPVNSQTPPPTAPATPTGATANATSSSAIDVTWVDQSNNETGFDVERAMGSSGPFVLISTTPADATTFTDQGLAPATQYCYRIRAINNTESSNYTSQVCATTQSVTGSPSAIAAFSFDETSGDVVVDDSGNGNGGFLDGGIDWNPAGRFNGGVEFFGFLPNRISLGGLDIPGNALTITGWFRADDFGTRDARILAKATGTSDADQYIMLSTFLQAGQIRLRFRLKTDIGDTTTLIANSGNLSPNTFYHVAAVYDGTEMRLYLDGALVGSTPKTGDIAQNPNANMWIGNNEMGRRPFDGVLDNLRIYDQALTPSELADDATTPVNSQTPPPTAPATPTGATANATSSSAIDVTWVDQSNNETGFDVERAMGSSGPFVLISTTPADATTFTDQGLAPATQYCYRIRAINNTESSNYTSQVCATTQSAPPLVPAAPTQLNASVLSDVLISLDWIDQAQNENGFEVERAMGSAGSFSPIATTAANTAVFDDSGLTPATQYCYRVRAFNNAGNSDNSNEICATTDPSAPQIPNAPGGLTAVAMSEDRVNLAWTDESDDEIFFDIEQSNSTNGPFSPVAAAGENETAISFSGLQPNTMYCYRVRARNNAGASNYTSVACATTQGNSGGLPAPYAAFSYDAASGDLTNDDSGNGRVGFIEGGAARTPVGYYDGAIEFFGVLTNRINLGGLDIPGNALTITGWFRADDFGTRDARILAKATGTSDADQYIMLSTFLQAGQIRLRFRLKTDIGDTTTLIANSGNLSPNTFYHVAAVYDGTEMRLYLDGALVGSTPKTGDIAQNPNANMWIGNNEMGRRPFDGVLDNLRIYDQALSVGQLIIDAATPVQMGPPPPPPLAPGAAIATATTASTIDVSWADQSANESVFEIERSTNGSSGPYQMIATTSANTEIFSDSNLRPDTEYCYRVRAVNAGGASAPSSDDCATTQAAPPPPAPPVGLSADRNSAAQVTVSWSDQSGNETAFEIHRSTDGPMGSFALLTQVSSNTESYADTSASPSTTQFCYRVRAVNAGGESAFSNTDCATTTQQSNQVVLFDTGAIVVSESGPNYPNNYYGRVECQTHIPLPNMDYTSPVNLSFGTVYQRMDVIERTSTRNFRANQQLQEPGFNGDHWWPSMLNITDPAVYTVDHPWNSMRDATGLKQRWNNPPPLRLAFAVQGAGGGCAGHSGPNSDWDQADIFPMKIRFTWVLVPPGETFTGWESVVGAQRPYFSPLGRPFATYTGSVSVTMNTATTGSQIRYTLDGSEPNSGSALYSGPIVLTSTTTLKAKAFKAGIAASDTTSYLYIVN